MIMVYSATLVAQDFIASPHKNFHGLLYLVFPLSPLKHIHYYLKQPHHQERFRLGLNCNRTQSLIPPRIFYGRRRNFLLNLLIALICFMKELFLIFSQVDQYSNFIIEVK